MVRAHRQAWCWQDEWIGLNMDDIRRLERETQAALEKKFGNESAESEEVHRDEIISNPVLEQVRFIYYIIQCKIPVSTVFIICLFK